MNRSALIGLCLAIVLIGWGISWELLRFQTGGEHLPEATVPVFYRFLIAGSLFAIFIVVRDLWRGQISFAFPLFVWGLIAALGLGFFSLNYSLYYIGQEGLPPGLVALFFAFVVVTNLGVTTLVTRRWPRRSTALAALVGFLGLAAVLWPSIWADGGIQVEWMTLRQASLCLAGTLVVSVATMVQVRLNKHEVPVVTSTAFAMLFGAVYVGLYSLWQGYSFDLMKAPFSFFAALTFLILLGSIGAFSAYLKLVGLIGPNRGAYVNLGSAALALIISYFVGTSGDWQLIQTVGVVFILGGAVLILRGNEAAPSGLDRTFE